MNRIANETYIHGVRDAWRANWVGRAFFLVVFICCFILMAFQLEGLFHGYISEAVGTRITSTTKSEVVEVPSFYYCNKNWLSKANELWHFKPIRNGNSLNKSYDRIYEECVHMAGYNRSVKGIYHPVSPDRLQYMLQLKEPEQYCKPFLEYWKSMIKQEVVNAIVKPLEDRSYEFYSKRRIRPEISVLTRSFAASILSDLVQPLLKSENEPSLRALVENSNLNSTIPGTWKNRACTTCKDGNKLTGAVLSQLLADSTGDVGYSKSEDNLLFYVYRQFIGSNPRNVDYDVLSNNTLNPSAVSTSLDGVCLEYQPGPQYQRTAEAVGRPYRHVIIHLGGLVHHLQILGHILTQTDILSRESNRTNDRSSMKHAVRTALNFAEVVADEYYTHVAVSKQNDPSLHFDQKIRVDSSKTRVSIKFWTNSNTNLNRKTRPCRPAPWTKLDQAHCNQQLTRLRHDKISCETYLPATGRYPETPVRHNTCIYDHTGIFKDIASAMSDIEGDGRRWSFAQSSDIAHQLSSFVPTRVSYDYYPDVIGRLTATNRDCPRPCSRTVFTYQTSYPDPGGDDVRLCHTALAYWMTPETLLSGPSREVWKNEWFTMKEGTTKRVWFHVAKLVILEDFGRKAPYCSVIEYEQTEAQGQISEQYLLYDMSDLAANVGGTLSLWIGASAMSVAQLVYLWCLKNQCSRIRRKVREAWRVMRRGISSRSVASTGPTGTAVKEAPARLGKRTRNEKGERI